MKKTILTLLALTLLAGAAYQYAQAADTGATLAGTGANDNSHGTTAWGSPENITASDDSRATAIAASNASPSKSTLFYAGDAYGSDQLATFGNPITTGASDATATLGGATEKWGATLTEAIIEDAGFGYAMACVLNPGATQSQYLAATNFGFNIPDGSTIDGITVRVEGYISTATCRVDSISMTVYYTEAASSNPATMQIRTGSLIINGAGTIKMQ